MTTLLCWSAGVILALHDSPAGLRHQFEGGDGAAPALRDCCAGPTAGPRSRRDERFRVDLGPGGSGIRAGGRRVSVRLGLVMVCIDCYDAAVAHRHRARLWPRYGRHRRQPGDSRVVEFGSEAEFFRDFMTAIRPVLPLSPFRPPTEIHIVGAGRLSGGRSVGLACWSSAG